LKKLIPLLALILLFTGCNTEEVSLKDNQDNKVQEEVEVLEEIEDVYISEETFVAQVNEIYMNKKDYLGKRINYEGYLFSYQPPEPYDMRFFVVRNGPGCCADDSTIGFEIQWDGDMPLDDEWCSVSGILEKYKDDGLVYLRVKIESIEVLETRGADTVIH